MLVDNVPLYIKAGDGGNGALSFLRNGLTSKGGPDGGDGGNGGNIYFQGSHNITDLREFRFKKKIIAENGIPGKKKKLFGKNAPHVTVFVPVGTRITDTATGRTTEITDTTTLLLLAKGGKGGRGNDKFKSATNQTPMFAEKGTLGERKDLLLELRLIADIGLIGLPNAGKSSLLAVLTHATPKIGNYPFTTLEPNIGVLDKYMIADIPGLIEGASKGKGLGVTFLKHIEKTKLLVHCIDSTDPEVEKTYQTVRAEFKAYNPLLLDKPEIILLTKIDLVDEKDLKKKIKLLQKDPSFASRFTRASASKQKVLTCSVYNQESLDLLKQEFKSVMQSGE